MVRSLQKRTSKARSFLYDQTSRDQLKIILINIEKKKFEDIQSFLDNLSIKNLKVILIMI